MKHEIRQMQDAHVVFIGENAIATVPAHMGQEIYDKARGVFDRAGGFAGDHFVAGILAAMSGLAPIGAFRADEALADDPAPQPRCHAGEAVA